MQLLVIGMHRSGTSALTRLLNLCGAYVGPETALTTANTNNPKGFWERRDVRELNDDLLESMGCDWHLVARLGEREPPAGALSVFLDGVRRLLGELDLNRPWVIKEPRLCLTLPWWRPLLEEPVCVFVHRNPLEIARSLAARNEFPPAFGVALWERYMQSALNASANLARCSVAHEEIIHSPMRAIERLLDDLSRLGVRGLHAPTAREVESFIDPQLQRHRTNPGELAEHVTSKQRALHEAFVDGTALMADFRHTVCDRAVRALVDGEAQFGDLPIPGSLARRAKGRARKTGLRA
jgi:hypothetical protein